MKTCTTCKQQKDLADFNKKKSTRDGLQAKCRECSKRLAQSHYLANKDYYLGKNAKGRKVKRDFLDALKQNLACVMCKESEPCCLDFHHLEQQSKDFVIAESANRNRSIECILEEIQKCICVCSNCHRKIHRGIIKYP